MTMTPDSSFKFGSGSKRRALFEKLLLQEKLGSTSPSTIPRRPATGTAPLSFAQERLWFLDQLEPDSAVYNIPMGLRLKGALNPSVLQRCLDEIVQRHEALRTRFETVEGQPYQVVEPMASPGIPLMDLSRLPEEQREAEARQLCTDEAHRPFDLAQGPLVRARLLCVGTEEHIFLLVMHHIASDGWSIGVLLRELKTLYQAFCENQPSPLPELPIQYADYAVWQRDWLRGEVLEQQLNYWKKQLEGAPARLGLPADWPRPATQSYRGALLSYELPKPLLPALMELSRREGASLFMTLLAVFQTLLYRYTGLEDIVVGSAIAGRNRTEVESLIGFFVNMLVLRGDLSGNPSFRTLLGRTREVALGAYAHQDLPFEKLVEVLQPERDMSHSPLFQVLFVLQNAPGESVNLAGVQVTPIQLHSGTSKFDLTLFIREGGESLKAMVEYNTDLFEAETIRRMLGHYQTLLEGIVSNPEQRLLDLPFLTERKRNRLLGEFRIELGEIESVLAGHPGVREAVVVLREDVPGDKRLVAYLTPKEGEPPTVSELRDRLQAKLPEHMVPSAFVTLDCFPMARNGKVDRQALPKPEFESVAAEFVPPSTPTEIALAKIWCEVLGLKQVGLHDNFFELGGHSLLAMRLISQIKRDLKSDLPVRALFQHPTIESLAKELTAQRTKGRKPELIQLQAGDSGPELFFVIDEGSLGLFKLAHYMGGDLPLYASVVPLAESALRASAKRQFSALPRMEDLAAEHAALIRSHPTTSPLLLAGHCFGGMLAFEVAHQLQRAGQQVEAVLMLDTWMIRPTSWWRKKTGFRAHFRRLLQQGPIYIWQKSRRRIKREKGKLVSTLKLAIHDDFSLHVPWTIIQRIYRHAGVGYQPQVLASRGMLFVSKDDWMSNAYQQLDDSLGASRLFSGGVEVFDVPGNHETVLDEPYLPELAECYKKGLEKLRSKQNSL
jgi:thioesterase domain-containing protein/acyl carrier protein